MRVQTLCRTLETFSGQAGRFIREIAVRSIEGDLLSHCVRVVLQSGNLA